MALQVKESYNLSEYNRLLNTDIEFSDEIKDLLRVLKQCDFPEKEAFLRDLISNASSALDEVHYHAMGNPQVMDIEPNLCIRIIPDMAAGTLTVWDTGIGLNRKQMVENFNKLFKRGAKEFIQQASKQRGEAIASNRLLFLSNIGLFSCFLVADKVRIISKHPMDNQYVWESNGVNSFRVCEDSGPDRLKRGTKVVLFMKESCKDFLNPDVLEDIVNRHCDWVNYPVELLKSQDMRKVFIEGQATEQKQPLSADMSWKLLLREQTPLWRRPPETVKQEEYLNFYQRLTNDFHSPLAWIHFSVDGEIPFTALLFIPQHDNLEPYDKEDTRHNVQLYIRRVYIMADHEPILPEWLSFVRGAVYCEDPDIRQLTNDHLTHIPMHIRERVLPKVYSMFRALADNKDAYTKFFCAFAGYLKRGLLTDPDHVSNIVEFLRFYTNKSGDNMVSLKEYCDRMDPSQKEIYYCIVHTREEADALLKDAQIPQNAEVVLVCAPFDEEAMKHIRAFANMKLVNLFPKHKKGSKESTSTAQARAPGAQLVA